MKVDTVYDEYDCEEAQTEIGECAESPVLWLDEHGPKDECHTTSSTSRTLEDAVSMHLQDIMIGH